MLNTLINSHSTLTVWLRITIIGLVISAITPNLLAIINHPSLFSPWFVVVTTGALEGLNQLRNPNTSNLPS